MNHSSDDKFDLYCKNLYSYYNLKTYFFLDDRFIRKHDILKLRIVLSTEGTAGILYMMGLKSGTFTHIFIDEAGQSTEPDILLPLCTCSNLDFFNNILKSCKKF